MKIETPKKIHHTIFKDMYQIISNATDLATDQGIYLLTDLWIKIDLATKQATLSGTLRAVSTEIKDTKWKV